jgi:hypothetical protein
VWLTLPIVLERVRVSEWVWYGLVRGGARAAIEGLMELWRKRGQREVRMRYLLGRRGGQVNK